MEIIRRPRRRCALLCTVCGREITKGQEYWACNGSRVCAGCLAEFARLELAPCREIRGEENRI
ncbi:MAG: hypothetical protein HFG08_06320 [Oscillibacter sp.]|nr:hypothetical protein [Oscillibacter sp.]